MIIYIERLLSREQVIHCTERLAHADWRCGHITAGPQSARVKANEQVASDCAEGRALGAMIVTELERHKLFLSAALPRHAFPPLFNRYAPGMSFGAHIDNALRPVSGTSYRIRTDISATLFLAEPHEYEGGELVVQDGDAQHRIKYAAGDMVLYPASTVHHVTPVTAGVRVAAFFWVQSMVRDAAARALLYDLDCAVRELAAAVPDAPAVVRLTGVYHNLVRRWAEP